MPQGYEVPFEDDGTPGEQLLGKGDKKRSTKTYFEDGAIAMYLGIVRGYTDQIMNAGRRMYAEEFNTTFDEASIEKLMEKFPEARELVAIHQNVVEHKGSQEGFLVDRYVNRQTPEEMDRKTERRQGSGTPQDLASKKRWT